MATARWLLLSEAASLFYARQADYSAFPDILKGGQVRVVGKRCGRRDAEPIENRLRRAIDSLCIDVSIDSAGNRITIRANEIAPMYHGFGIGRVNRELDDVLGGHGFSERIHGLV